MKTTISFFVLLLIMSIGNAVHAQSERVAFTLKNTLGYHRMFRAEGPGMAYGFTMNRNERTPKNWPVGSKLYFSKDGETNGEYILTVTAADAGKTLNTDPDVNVTPTGPMISVRFRNNSALPHKVAMITYKPGESGNGTNIFMIMPYATTKQRFPVGTKVYFADDKQVDVVMSGNRIDSSNPRLTVKPEDAGKTVDIFD